MADGHLSNLKNMCRICGSLLGKDSFDVLTYSDKILECFYISGMEDHDLTHPKIFCRRCFSQMLNINKRESTSKHCFRNWVPHSENCDVCIKCVALKKGG